MSTLARIKLKNKISTYLFFKITFSLMYIKHTVYFQSLKICKTWNTYNFFHIRCSYVWPLRIVKLKIQQIKVLIVWKVMYDAEILKYLKTAVSYFQIHSHKPFCYKSRSNPLQDITNFQNKQVLILKKEIWR